MKKETKMVISDLIIFMMGMLVGVFILWVKIKVMA
jgi:hypothetical protein